MALHLSEQHKILGDKRGGTLAKALTEYKDLLRSKKEQFAHTARHNGVFSPPCNINQ